jgi:hypothetical protein
VITAVLLLDLSAPGSLFGWICDVYVVPPLFCLLVGNYLLRLAASLASLARGAESLSRKRARPGRSWLVAPLCGLLVVSVAVHPWSADIRFWLSRPALERLVENDRPRNNTFVGLYYVWRVDRYDDGVTFVKLGGQMFGDTGFLFKPGPLPADTYDPELSITRSLGGPWYVAVLDRW